MKGSDNGMGCWKKCVSDDLTLESKCLQIHFNLAYKLVIVSELQFHNYVVR